MGYEKNKKNLPVDGQAQEDINELRKIRLEKLQKLQQEGTKLALLQKMNQSQKSIFP